MNWKLDIIQAQAINIASEEHVQLKRLPFTFRITMRNPIPVRLNVLADDSNYTMLKTGFITDFLENGEVVNPFMLGTGLTEGKFNQDESIALEQIGHHYIYYENEQKHRWSRVEFTPDVNGILV